MGPEQATLFQPGGMKRDADKPLVDTALTDSILEVSQKPIADSEHQFGKLHYKLIHVYLECREKKETNSVMQISAAYADFTLQHYGQAMPMCTIPMSLQLTRDVTNLLTCE